MEPSAAVQPMRNNNVSLQTPVRTASDDAEILQNSHKNKENYNVENFGLKRNLLIQQRRKSFILEFRKLLAILLCNFDFIFDIIKLSYVTLVLRWFF